ncbi:MAG: hypothetical protein ACP5KS_11905, partial [Candidatus Hydrogenedens sp.]
IRLGINTKWSDENQRNLNEEYQGHAFKNEIDIACVFGQSYLVIACKVSKRSFTITNKINKIKAQSEILGRMSIPILVILKHHSPPEIKDGVPVIGWKTLFDEIELAETIKKND